MKSGIALALLAESLSLYPKYVTRGICQGRLIGSSVGDETLVRLEALPKELGCGVLLKPLAGQGRTNLILETSAGTFNRIIEIHEGKSTPAAIDLLYRFSEGTQ